jgi:hypothetical protein
MQDNNLKYGFTISLPEYPATIPTLWDAVREFIKEHPEYVVEGNAMGFLSDNGGKEYNNCHCESASRLFPSQAIRGVIFFVPALEMGAEEGRDSFLFSFPFYRKKNALTNTTHSLVQLRDRRPRPVEGRGVHEVLRVPRFEGGESFLLVGRCFLSLFVLVTFLVRPFSYLCSS